MAQETWLAVVNDWFSYWSRELIVSLLVLLIGFIIARMLRKMVFHLLHELELNDLLFQLTKVKMHTEEYLSNMLAYIVYGITFVIALNQLGVAVAVVYVVLFGVLFILMLVFLLVMRDFIPNFFAGLKLSKNRLFQENHLIQVCNLKGRVMKITLLDIQIKNEKGDLIVIPNTMLVKEKVVVLRAFKKADHVK